MQGGRSSLQSSSLSIPFYPFLVTPPPRGAADITRAPGIKVEFTGGKVTLPLWLILRDSKLYHHS
jgi:hypothetical protein